MLLGTHICFSYDDTYCMKYFTQQKGIGEVMMHEMSC